MAKRISTKNLSVEDTAELDQYLLETENKPAELLKKLRKFKPINQTQSELEREIYNKDLVFVTGAAGTGKAQPLYSTVYTPNGPVKMGDLKIGDKVCNTYGGESEILGIFPQGIKSTYRIWFTDGVSVDCCEDHLWNVQTAKLRSIRSKKGKWETVTTKEMVGKIMSGGKRNFKLPICAPVLYNKQDLPIDPYLLGVLLGDGGMTGSNTMISSADQELIERVRGILKEINYSLVHASNYDYRIKSDSRQVNIINRVTQDLGIRVKSEFKFIPKCYLYSSVENRINLLNGLMDADGTIDKRGNTPTYYTSSVNLANDVAELVRSLGGIAKISIKKTPSLDCYVVSVSVPNNIEPFWITRKKERVIKKTKYFPNRFVDRIEKIDDVEHQCISVNSSDSLYLTDYHVVTHNTYATLAIALNMIKDKTLNYNTISLSKSVVQIKGEEMGFLPGDLKEKLEPVMYSYTANINKIFGVSNASDSLLKSGQVEWKPVAYLRGCQFDHSIVILDEAQNLDVHCIKTLITRIGKSSKLIIMGDLEQYDRGNAKNSGMETIKDILKDSPYVGVVEFKDSECVRNPIITDIVKKLRVHNI